MTLNSIAILAYVILPTSFAHVISEPNQQVAACMVYMLRPICEIAQFMNWAPLMPSSWNGQ